MATILLIITGSNEWSRRGRRQNANKRRVYFENKKQLAKPRYNNHLSGPLRAVRVKKEGANEQVWINGLKAMGLCRSWQVTVELRGRTTKHLYRIAIVTRKKRITVVNTNRTNVLTRSDFRKTTRFVETHLCVHVRACVSVYWYHMFMINYNRSAKRP